MTWFFSSFCYDSCISIEFISPWPWWTTWTFLIFWMVWAFLARFTTNTALSKSMKGNDSTLTAVPDPSTIISGERSWKTKIETLKDIKILKNGTYFEIFHFENSYIQPSWHLQFSRSLPLEINKCVCNNNTRLVQPSVDHFYFLLLHDYYLKILNVKSQGWRWVF